VTPLAYVLIVVVPLIAFITVGLALLPGRSVAGRTLQSSSIQARINAIDEQLVRQVGLTDADRKRMERERRQLQTELMRRGLGRFTASGSGDRPD
jgi:hypothetical protein